MYENIVLPIELDGKHPDQKYVKRIVQALGLENKINSLPSHLSGGQQRKCVARALAAKPAILLCDEPTGNLDSKTSLDM